MNDWSARDIQAWEYVPLGPFLGKSFQTSISAWVTPLALLEPRRVEAPPQEPPPLPHLAGGRDWALDLDLELELNGEVVSRGNARTLYWTMPQQLAHATSNGATVRTGDLMATGTISGAEPGSEGSLLELWRGERFLADGDEVVLRARGGEVELGEVRGRVVGPANGNGERVSFDHHDPRFVEDPGERDRADPRGAPARALGPVRRLLGAHALRRRDGRGARPRGVHLGGRRHDAHPAVAAARRPAAPDRARPAGAHACTAALVNPLFAKPRIDALRPELEALATRLLEPIVRNGGGDVMAEFAHPMSLGSLARFMNLPGGGRGALVRLGRADVLERAARQGRPGRGRARRRGLHRRADRRAQARSRATTSSGCCSRRRSTATA